MQKLNGKHVGLALGGFMALVHLVWVIMVGVGWAKPSIDFILGLHHLSVPYAIMPFSLGAAVVLVIFTFVVGWVAGWVFSCIWNAIKK